MGVAVHQEYDNQNSHLDEARAVVLQLHSQEQELLFCSGSQYILIRPGAPPTDSQSVQSKIVNPIIELNLLELVGGICSIIFLYLRALY